jgi:uncharacterized protein DUF4340
MNDARITAAFGGVALLLLLVTWATTPRVSVSSIFADRGQVLFPAFRDPNSAASLEIIEFDARIATVRPFKVQNRNGRWTIPSQHDYPVDAKDRLAKTAAAIIGLRKDDVASDSAADHERCGVLDPLEAALPAINGRGTRLIVRGAQAQMLADVIIGTPVEGRPAFRYVRQPGQRRVYVSNVGDLSISTAFGDWIERDLLEIGADEIDAVNLRNYSLDRRTRRTNPGETMLLQKIGDGAWTINGLAVNEELAPAAVDNLLRNLTRLTIVGVLPKPPGISAALGGDVSSTVVTPEDRADLGRKGFYLASTGALVSNRGELVVRTIRGVFYTLRFGEIAPGNEPAAAAATPAATADAQATASRENRYLFVTVDFDPESARTPGRASEGAEKTKVLRARFAPWYYVITADSFDAIRLQRSNLVKRRIPRSG